MIDIVLEYCGFYEFEYFILIKLVHSIIFDILLDN